MSSAKKDITSGTLGPPIIDKKTGEKIFLISGQLFRRPAAREYHPMHYCPNCRKGDPKAEVDEKCALFCIECHTKLLRVRYIEK